MAPRSCVALSHSTFEQVYRHVVSPYPDDLVAAQRRLQQLRRELTAGPTEAWRDGRGRERAAHDGWPAGAYERVEALREQIWQTCKMIGPHRRWSALSGEALMGTEGAVPGGQH